MTDERRAEIEELFNAETNDPETEWWRDDLTDEEAEYVDELDERFSIGFQKCFEELCDIMRSKNEGGVV